MLAKRGNAKKGFQRREIEKAEPGKDQWIDNGSKLDKVIVNGLCQQRREVQLNLK